MSTALESRYGFSFGATTIMASRFNSTGIVELTAFPASSEYRDLYAEAVKRFPASDDDPNEANVNSIFADDVERVIEELTRQTDQTPEIATLFMPSIFDWKTRSVAAHAAFSSAKYATRAATARTAACWGYGFLDGRNLGRPMADCNDDGPTSLVLLFEYEKEYLYAWLVHVDFELGVYSAEEEHICKDCGEEYRETIGTQAYHDRINNFVNDFVELKVLRKYKREDIRAIVISGEASVAGVKELGECTLEAVGTEDVKLMGDFESAEVVAHGAAVFARLTQEHPEYFNTRSSNKVPDEAYWAEVAARKAREEAKHNEL